MTKTKKRICSKAKGNRNELEIAHILSDNFNDKFSRVGVSSGARTKNSNLTDDAMQFYAGDIVCPKNFSYSLEVKSGYNAASLTRLNTTIDSFIDQAEKDAEIAGKKPCILFKQDRMPWLCFLRNEEYKRCQTYIKYRDYFIYDLKEILEKKEDWYENFRDNQKSVIAAIGNSDN